MQELAVRKSIREFIQENMNTYDDGAEFSDSDDIFALGFVSSIFAMRLLDYLERECQVAVSDEDVVLANFKSVDAMMHLANKVKSRV